MTVEDGRSDGVWGHFGTLLYRRVAGYKQAYGLRGRKRVLDVIDGWCRRSTSYRTWRTSSLVLDTLLISIATVSIFEIITQAYHFKPRLRRSRISVWDCASDGEYLVSNKMSSQKKRDSKAG
jgi:hypothetical protein